MGILTEIKKNKDRPYMCSEDVYDQTMLYWNLTIATLVCTIIMVMTFMCVLRKKLDGAPGLAAQFFFVTGSVIVFSGLALVVVFQPECPRGCDPSLCAEMKQYMPGSFFGLFIITMGFIWMYFGRDYLERAQQLAGTENARNLVYGPVSQIECTALDSASASEDDNVAPEEYHDDDEAYDDGYEGEEIDNSKRKSEESA